jgi:diguanylate cyclase (GGDEF)-like protein
MVIAGHVATLQRLQTALDYDNMTGAHSRLYFLAALRQEVARFTRDDHALAGQGFTVGILDVDHFKQINDGHGHEHGDKTLLRVVEESHRLLCRDLDVFARYGGDEFVFLLPQTSIQPARALAEKLRAAMASLLLPDGWEPITVSIGLAACPEHGENVESLLHAADWALYRAKQTRNAVCLAGEL